MSLREIVRSGQLIVIPTDTVYGIAADPNNSTAVSRLLQAKGRGESMPPPVLAASIEEALDFADRGLMTHEAWLAANRLARRFWPGALTLVLPTRATLGWPAETVAVRVPNLQGTRELLGHTGPLAVTSANLTGQQPALTVEQARSFFGSTVSEYIDGGPAPIGVASTIVSLAEWPARMLRLGALDWGEIAPVLEGTY